MMPSDRYLRHSLIDWFSQESIKESCVAVVGAGAVGNEVIKNLSLLGVGNIDIFDFDKIEEHNLTRSVLFRDNDINKSKAEVAKIRASRLDSSISINCYHGDVWDTLKIDALQKYGCIISCVDNFEARLKLNSLCLLYNVDFINAGIDSRYVSVEVFPYSSHGGIACYECSLPDSVYERIQERYSCGWLKKASFEEKKIPTTIITSSIAGAISTSCALRLGSKHGDTSLSYKILYDTITNTMSKTIYERNHNCIVCDVPEDRVYLTCLNEFHNTLHDIVVPDDLRVTTSEQIVVGASCSQCNKVALAALYKNTRKLNDEIMRCQDCLTRSVVVDIKDSFTFLEIQELLTRSHVDSKYAYVNMNGRLYIINMEV